MQLSIFNDLCLICANYDCESESSHQKYTLHSMEQLLAQYFLLQVSYHKKCTQIYSSNNSQNSSQILGEIYKLKHQNHVNKAKQNSKLFPVYMNDILQVLEKIKHKKLESLDDFYKLLVGSLSTIYFLQTFESDPLLFHDILYVIKMITYHKYRVSQKTNKNENLPFTQKRIKRTIKNLESRILNTNKLFQNKKINQRKSKIQNRPLKDITNQIQKRRDFNDSINNNQLVKNQYKKIDVEQIICSDISLRNLTQQLRIIIQENKLIDKEVQIYFINRFLIQIENIQLNLAQQILTSQKLHNTHKKIISHQRNQQTFDFQQQAETIQFTFIQGVPFPKNRRSVDFSVLQITDQILFGYLSSLQKLKDLEQLCIRKNHLSGLSYKILKNTFPKLRSLDIGQNLITPDICQSITSFKSLNILYISECRIQSKSLIQICLKLNNLNVLYCDNLVLLNEDNRMISLQTEDSDLKGIFYIMTLNLKKLMYLSIKGYFNPKIIDQMFRNNPYSSSICLSQFDETKELKIFQNIYQTLQKRHGVVQI